MSDFLGSCLVNFAFNDSSPPPVVVSCGLGLYDRFDTRFDWRCYPSNHLVIPTSEFAVFVSYYQCFIGLFHLLRVHRYPRDGHSKAALLYQSESTGAWPRMTFWCRWSLPSPAWPWNVLLTLKPPLWVAVFSPVSELVRLYHLLSINFVWWCYENILNGFFLLLVEYW